MGSLDQPHLANSTLVGDERIPLENLHRFSAREISKLSGVLRESGDPTARTPLGRLFEVLTSNVAPGEFDRVEVKDVYTTAQKLCANYGDSGVAVVVYALLCWSAPQIRDACRQALEPHAARGVAIARDALAIAREGFVDARRALQAKRIDPSVMTPQPISDGGHLATSAAAMSHFAEAVQGLGASAVLQSVKRLAEEGFVHLVALARRNPEGRSIALDDRFEQAKRQLEDSDFVDRAPPDQDRFLAATKREMEAQFAARKKADETVAIFVVSNRYEVDPVNLTTTVTDLAGRLGLAPAPVFQKLDPESFATVGETLIRGWEHKLTHGLGLESGPITPTRFVDWQRRLQHGLGRSFEIVTPQAADQVTLREFKQFQINLSDCLRIGVLTSGADGRNRFHPKEAVADISVAGLSKILWNTLQGLREKSAWALCPRTVNADNVTSWLSALNDHFGIPSTPELIRSPIPSLAAVLEEALVWDGPLIRDARKAYWDDTWHLAHDMWFGAEEISSASFETRFGRKPEGKKKNALVATEVYLCKSVEAATRAARSYAEKGRLPQPVRA